MPSALSAEKMRSGSLGRSLQGCGRRVLRCALSEVQYPDAANILLEFDGAVFGTGNKIREG